GAAPHGTQSKMTVRWTEAALADLESLKSYIARRSTRYANEVVERIISKSEGLSAHPFIGAIVPEYETDQVREVFEAPCRIMYRVIEDVGEVHILAAIHAARRLPRRL